LDSSLVSFLEEANPSINYFPTSYLDSADAYEAVSKSFDGSITTNGPIAADAFTNCKAAEASAHITTLGLRAFSYYQLIGNYSKSQEALHYATIEHTKFRGFLNSCIASLESLGL
jgi:hypothetical protein